MVRISIIYDNHAQDSLQADWGFSALVETRGEKVLFDAGADDEILLSNAAAMNLELGDTDYIFLSHNHFDHTGGLAGAIRACPGATVLVPPSLRGVKRGKKVLRISGRTEFGEGFVSTGEIDSIEQSLIVPSPSGCVIVTGCSHHGLKPVLDMALASGRVHAVLGGLHGFSDLDLLAEVDRVCPTHCTVHAAEIASIYPEKFLPGGVGKVYEFPYERKGNH